MTHEEPRGIFAYAYHQRVAKHDEDSRIDKQISSAGTPLGKLVHTAVRICVPGVHSVSVDAFGVRVEEMYWK